MKGIESSHGGDPGFSLGDTRIQSTLLSAVGHPPPSINSTALPPPHPSSLSALSTLLPGFLTKQPLLPSSPIEAINTHGPSQNYLPALPPSGQFSPSSRTTSGQQLAPPLFAYNKQPLQPTTTIVGAHPSDLSIIPAPYEVAPPPSLIPYIHPISSTTFSTTLPISIPPPPAILPIAALPDSRSHQSTLSKEVVTHVPAGHTAQGSLGVLCNPLDDNAHAPHLSLVTSQHHPTIVSSHPADSSFIPIFSLANSASHPTIHPLVVQHYTPANPSNSLCVPTSPAGSSSPQISPSTAIPTNFPPLHATVLNLQAAKGALSTTVLTTNQENLHNITAIDSTKANPPITPSRSKSFLEALYSGGSGAPLPTVATLPEPIFAYRPPGTYQGKPTAFFSDEEIEIAEQVFAHTLILKFSSGNPALNRLRDAIALWGI